MALDAKFKDLKYEMQDEEARPAARIKVLGVGGGGSNAVAHMMAGGLDGVEFHVLNTDAQALQASPVPNKIRIGAQVTRGRGAGGDPEVGRQAALEDTERVLEALAGAEMVFVTAGLGSGTGTGAAPVVASLAKEMNALTVAIVTKPFTFEGSRRMKQAEQGLAELAANVDCVIAIPNERLLQLAPRGTSLVEAFRMGHDFVRQTIQDIVELMTSPGFVNRDFSDIRSVMVGMGYAVLGTATARGENPVLEAARQAIASPLLEESGIRGARNVLLNVTGSSRLSLHDLNDACIAVREATGTDDVQLNFGIVLNEAMEDSVKVSVIATSFGEPPREQPPARRFLSETRPAPPAPAVLDAQPEPEPAPAEETRPANGTPAPPVSEPEDLDDLDTPAYLRRRVLQ